MPNPNYMRLALGLAQRGLGNTWPNPTVGCVIVKDDIVVGRGFTQKGGRPHAEVMALRQAGSQALGADAYVTLEPCAHHGQTPPCAAALIEAGIKRVFAALEDPDPRVVGKGFQMLSAAGIEVFVGLEKEKALEINLGFFMRVIKGRPMVTWKTATSLDGKTATHSGESQWITGERAREFGHLLRAQHDAIMIGAGTALADNPSLACRIPGLENRSPVRVIMDGRLRLSLNSLIAETAGMIPTWVVTFVHGDKLRKKAFLESGVDLLEIPPDQNGNLDLALTLKELARRGMTRVLLEGGAHLTAAMLRSGFVDRIAWFKGGMVIGGDGHPAAQPFGVFELKNAPRFHLRETYDFGADRMEYWAAG